MARLTFPARLARNKALLLGLLPLQATAALASEPVTTYRIEATTGNVPTLSWPREMMMDLDLELTLTAPVAPPAKPEASHAIPAAMAMRSPLSLEVTSGCKPGECESQESRQAAEQIRSKRVHLYWGCEARAGAGQPQTLEAGKNTLRQMLGEVQRKEKVQPAAPTTTSTAWRPNREAAGGFLLLGMDDELRSLPLKASLVGEHLVRSNYTPEIRFSLAKTQDFLGPLNLSATPTKGATDLGWNRVAGVVGYLGTAIGQKEGEIVIWVSNLGGKAASPADSTAKLESLVGSGGLLGAERSQCTISAEATRALGTAAVVNLEGLAGAIQLNPVPGQVVRLERTSKSAATLDF